MPLPVHIPRSVPIAVADDAPAPVRFAAEELARHLKEAGGVDAVPTDQAAGDFTIRLDARCPAGFADALAPEAFRYRVSSAGIDIAGGSPRGTVYGVYGFLEEVLGYRWYTSTVRRVPDWDGTLPCVDTVRTPAFSYREVYWRDATDGDFALRLRLNSARARIADAHGGRVRFHRFSHTFDALIPPEEYFDTHPEYFAMVDGKRLKERTQLCLTNPDVLRLAKARVRRWIAENPDCTIFSVAQNDWYHNCTCPACQALDAREGSPAGSMLHFVNAIADDIAAEYPHVMLHTFAYMFSRRAPRFVRPRPNVIVRLCSIECCFAAPLDACTWAIGDIDVQDGVVKNGFTDQGEALFLRDLREWSAICKNLYIWDYTVNFANYPQPFPNLHVMQPNLRLFQAHGVTGVFEQGNFSPGSASAFAGLKTYLLAKLLWDPDADADALTQDFLHGVFGESAGALAAYLHLMERAVAGHHMGLYDPPNAPYFTDALLEKADALFAEAEKAAPSTEIRDRVALERLSVRYVRLARLPPGAPGRDEGWDAFHADANRLGVTEVFERKSLPESIECLKRSRYGLNREGVPYLDYLM